MVKKSLNTIQELSQSDLDLEIKDYEKEIKKLNYELNNYDNIITNFSKDLKKLVTCHKDCHIYFKKNFKFKDFTKSKFLILNKNLKDLIYKKESKIILLKKIKKYFSLQSQMVNYMENFYDRYSGEQNINDKIFGKEWDMDDDDKWNAFSGNKLPFGIVNSSPLFKYLSIDKSYSFLKEKGYWYEEDFTENTLSFFDEMRVGNYNFDTNEFYILKKNKFLEIIKDKIEKIEKEFRKRILVSRGRKIAKKKDENVGYVYVLYNEAYPKTYKIGSTYILPEKRAEELTGTGHLTPFKVVFKIKIQRAEYFEKTIHRLLHKFRIKKGREFFKLELNKIKNCLEQVDQLSDNGIKRIKIATLKNRINI